MGLFDAFRRRGPGRPRNEPVRDTIQFPNMVQTGQFTSTRKVAYKPTPRNLRYFSCTPYCRRAINSIKNPIAMLDWRVKPRKGVEMNAELERQIEIATYCLNHPNEDDSARTLIEAVTEDVLLGAGAIEIRPSGDALRPVWMWPVDGLTIQIYPGWAGGRDEARYRQIVGYGNYSGFGSGKQIDLRNDELIYIRPNPTSATPFGKGPVEVAFTTISRLLGVGEFAGNVASNARPSIGLDLGDGITANGIAAFRAYWRNEVEGQGNMPIFGLEEAGGSANGKTRGASVMRFYPEGDNGLYLQYQEFLKREIAASFDISPQNLGIERDVNRSTSDVAEDRDRRHAIKPHATLLASHFTREMLHRTLGFSQLEFQFLGVDQDDDLNLAQVYKLEYENNAITPNEYRERIGMSKSQSEWGDKHHADVEIAMQAARGAGTITDTDLPAGTQPRPDRKGKGE